MRASISLLVASAVLLGSAAETTAQHNRDRLYSDVSQTVRAWDLDLSETTDARILYERIRSAAEVACRRVVRFNDHTYRKLRSLREECVRTAVEQAVASSDIDALTAAHRIAIRDCERPDGR